MLTGSPLPFELVSGRVEQWSPGEAKAPSGKMPAAHVGQYDRLSFLPHEHGVRRRGERTPEWVVDKQLEPFVLAPAIDGVWTVANNYKGTVTEDRNAVGDNGAHLAE